MKSLSIRLTILLISSLIFFGLLELIARDSLSYVARSNVSNLGGSLEADPELLIEYTAAGRRLVPNADVVIHNHYVSGLDVDIKTNSLGLRDKERGAYAQEGVKRILFVGDSIIAQDYLPTDKTLVSLLEKQLNQQSGTKFEVINAGLSNSGIEEQYQLLSEIIQRLNPDLVLLSFYLNDSRPAWGFSGEIGAKRGWLRKHSIVAETIIRELEVRKWLSDSKIDRFKWMPLLDTLPWKSEQKAFQQIIAAAPFDWGAAWDIESWGKVATNVQKFKQITTKHSSKFGIIAMPVAYQVMTDFIDDFPQQQISKIAQSYQIPIVSLLEEERNNREEEIFFDWCHPNFKGNQVIAPIILKFIKDNFYHGN
jgi:lysophospholipase L1-like esterase